MNKLASAKKFVYRHRVSIAVISTAAICLTIHARSQRELNDFLEEKGLTAEYYTGE